jgi:hypothetical protein
MSDEQMLILVIYTLHCQASVQMPTLDLVLRVAKGTTFFHISQCQSRFLHLGIFLWTFLGPSHKTGILLLTPSSWPFFIVGEYKE